MNRLKDAISILASIVRGGTGPTSATSLVAAAQRAGSALDALQQLKEQEAVLMRQLMILHGSQSTSMAHALSSSEASTSSAAAHAADSATHARAQSGAPSTSKPSHSDLPATISALNTLRQAVPPLVLNRMTRFSVEQGAAHVTRGLSRSYAGPVGGSSTMAQETDPFGLLMVGSS
jgi:hypothetical protein